MASEHWKNKILDATNRNVSFAQTPYFQAHNGAPGVAGTSNVLACARVAPTYGAASGGAQATSEDVVFLSVPEGQITHISKWDAAGTGTPPTGGNFIDAVQLPEPVTVPAGTPNVRFLAGDISEGF